MPTMEGKVILKLDLKCRQGHVTPQLRILQEPAISRGQGSQQIIKSLASFAHFLFSAFPPSSFTFRSHRTVHGTILVPALFPQPCLLCYCLSGSFLTGWLPPAPSFPPQLTPAHYFAVSPSSGSFPEAPLLQSITASTHCVTVSCGAIRLLPLDLEWPKDKEEAASGDVKGLMKKSLIE